MDNPMRILIIDDDEGVLRLLESYFSSKGMESSSFAEPPDLKRVIGDLHPDAVLLDIVLPHKSGLDVLADIKGIYPQLPVIMMTGYTDYDKNIESLRKGAYAFLTKPFLNLEEIYHVTNNAVCYHRELLRTQQLSEEIARKLEFEKINLLELDFLKSLNRLIGETENPATVLSNSFSLLRSFLNFEIFAALIPGEHDLAIHVYPISPVATVDREYVSTLLLEKGSESVRSNMAMTVTLNGSREVNQAVNRVLASVTATLASRNKTYGYAGLFRGNPFTADEEAIFRRFCSHISLTLEKIALFQEIKSLSIHDGLTGIYNHMFVLKKLDEEAERARRYDTEFSIVLFDVDDFKMVNDRHGHLAGDYVLRRVAELLKEGLRSIDIAGRYGGEEFLVILPETDSERGYKTAERLRRSIEQEPFHYEGSTMHVTVSGGLAAYKDGADAKSLVMLADNNLYAAKNEGKNRIYHDKP